MDPLSKILFCWTTGVEPIRPRINHIYADYLMAIKERIFSSFKQSGMVSLSRYKELHTVDNW